ncbi:hypothetical protein G6F68_020972 [Rhizopus microsporus]|nr:hypothetical protein G6F68_020972 [Rhizopus microsporus]
MGSARTGPSDQHRLQVLRRHRPVLAGLSEREHGPRSGAASKAAWAIRSRPMTSKARPASRPRKTTAPSRLACATTTAP